MDGNSTVLKNGLHGEPGFCVNPPHHGWHLPFLSEGVSGVPHPDMSWARLPFIPSYHLDAVGDFYPSGAEH